jgi:cobalt transporter subunit CbtA
MLTRLMAAAVFAGLASGLIVAGLQAHFATPLILQAETYEAKGGGHDHVHAPGEPAHSHAGEAASERSGESAGGHDHHAGEWQPADGLERFAYSALATVATAIGYALLLSALLFAIGIPMDARTLVAWGLGAFVATSLAPAIGLPPSLPGTGESELIPRQAWWAVTAVATGAGLYVLSHHWRNLLAVAGGLALLALPHVWGAPAAVLAESQVPVTLAAQFAARSLALSLVLWVTIAIGLALAFAKLDAPVQEKLA